LHEAIGKWQLCAMAYQAQLEVKSKVEKQSKELKDKLFAMMDLVGNRQKVKAIQALREITGCTLNEGKVVLDKVFENFAQEQAKVIPLPPSSLAKQMELLPEP
jgi:ribosomal protein L7/L12